MIGINNCDKCCNMQQAENVDQSKDNSESQVTICLFLQAMFHHDTPNVSWWVKFTPYVWCSLWFLYLGSCVTVCCLYYFLISTLYNFLLLPPTYCGSDISGTNQYLAPSLLPGWDVCCSRTAVGQLPAAAGPAAAPSLFRGKSHHPGLSQMFWSISTRSNTFYLPIYL